MNDSTVSTGHLIALASPVFFSTGILYLMGFWAPFDINFLEYASISDTIALAIQGFVPAVIGVLMGLVFFTMFPRFGRDKRGGTDTLPEVRFLKKHWRWPIGILALASVYLLIDRGSRASILVLVWAPFITNWLEARSVFRDSFPSYRSWSYSLFFGVTILAMAYPVGHMNGLARKTQPPEYRVTIDGKSFGYVGKLGNSMFVWCTETKSLNIFTPLPERIEFQFKQTRTLSEAFHSTVPPFSWFQEEGSPTEDD